MDLEICHATIHEATKNGDLGFLKLYLNTKRTAKVEARIVELCLESGYSEIVGLFVKRENTHPNITQLALSWSIVHFKKEWAEYFVTLDGALENKPEMLKQAIKTNNSNIIEVLLPYISSVSSEILCAAVRTNNANVVRKIIPLCNPKEQSSAALKEAVAFQNQEIFDILYPLSTPEEAWESIRKDSWFDATQRKMIKSRLDVDRQKAKLEKAVKLRLPTGKQKKM